MINEYFEFTKYLTFSLFLMRMFLFSASGHVIKDDLKSSPHLQSKFCRLYTYAVEFSQIDTFMSEVTICFVQSKKPSQVLNRSNVKSVAWCQGISCLSNA